MTPARRSRRACGDARLLVLSGEVSAPRHARLRDLPDWLREGDVLAVNDAATIPASFRGTHAPSGRSIEVRLARSLADGEGWDPSRWLAVVLGGGTWRDKTEDRASPPGLRVGDRLELGSRLRACVRAVSPASGRLVELELASGPRDEPLAIWSAIYRAGRPIQYSYLRDELEVWDQQTLFASAPVALEPPSASFQLSWDLMDRLRGRGVEVVPITHAAGISSLGSPELDRQLPFPERSWISPRASAALGRALAEGRRIIAAGTSVARAIESGIEPGSRVTSLRLGEGRPLERVSGLLTGMHEPGSSHLELLGAFAASERVAGAYAEAEALGYLSHEYGDVALILGAAPQGRGDPSSIARP